MSWEAFDQLLVWRLWRGGFCVPSGSRFRSLSYSMAFLLSWRKANIASVQPLPFRNPICQEPSRICALLNKDRMTTEWGRAVTWLKNSTSVRESGFLLLVEFGILGIEILNTAQWNRKLLSIGIRNPPAGVLNPISEIRNPQRGN